MNPEIKKRLEMIKRGEVPTGYKKTKVGVIPKEWESTNLYNIAEITMGTSPSSHNYNDEKIGLPLLQGNADIKKRLSNPKTWTSELTKTCNVGDILISVRAPVGTVAKSAHHACIGRGLAKINAINSNQEYLFQYLLFFENKWNKISQGSTFDSITGDTLKNISVIVPALTEQNYISKILSDCDEAIEKQEKLIEFKKEFKKGLAFKLLTGKIRFRGFIGNWRNKSLSEYFEKINEKNDENNNNILTMSAQIGLIRQEHFFSKQVASENLSRYFLLKNGDYAYNKSYSIGYPFGAIKRLEKFEKGILSPLYICFRIKKRSISNDYCKHYFDSGLLNKEIQKIAQEGARNHGLLNVSSEEFFQMCMHVPTDIREQEAIAEILTTSDREIEILEKELEMIKEQKKGLMELLLTGIVRVK